MFWFFNQILSNYFNDQYVSNDIPEYEEAVDGHGCIGDCTECEPVIQRQ